MKHVFTSRTNDPLVDAASKILSEANIKVPQKFVDYAREVGSTVLFAELTYRNWKPRGLTDQQILDKIKAHGEKKKNEEVDESYQKNRLDREKERKDAEAAAQKERDAKAGLRKSLGVTKKNEDTGLSEGLEDYRTKSNAVRKIMNSFVMLDADDMEDMLFSITSYFAEEGIDSGKDFTDVAALMNKAAVRWKARSGN
jgi:hypothetical protein